MNRDKYNLVLGAKILLSQILSFKYGQKTFIVIDEHHEFRYSSKLPRVGKYRDAIRSKVSGACIRLGLKWMVCGLVVKVPLSSNPKVLPFIALLMNSKGHDEKNAHYHRKPVDYLHTLSCFIKKWTSLSVHIIGDGAYGTVENIQVIRKYGHHLVSKLRRDARVYEKPKTPEKGKKGRKPVKGERISCFEDMAKNEEGWITKVVRWYGGENVEVQFKFGTHLLWKSGLKPELIQWVLVKNPITKKGWVPFFTTDLSMDPVEIIEAYVLRFGIETVFQECRAHMGIETQRQHSDKAIVRSTPFLFGLYSLVNMMGVELFNAGKATAKNSAWYVKSETDLTFSDIIYAVRPQCWLERNLIISTENDDLIKMNSKTLQNIIDILSTSTA